MKAAYLDAIEKVQLRDIQAIHPDKDSVVIQPIFTAICGSDVSFFKGHRVPPTYPMILGHEVVGQVVGIGSNVSKVQVGQRVVVEPNYPCGECSFCRSGRGNICPNKKSLGGSIPGCFAEQFTAPDEFCWPLSEKISDLDAVLIEPLAVSLHALEQSNSRPEDAIAVLGAGSTGLLLVHAAACQGIRVFAHDKFKEKTEMARRLGAIDAETDDLAGLWAKENVKTIFECAGSSAAVEFILNSAPRGSQVILMGLAMTNANFQPFRFVREGLSLRSSLIYDHPADFPKTIALVEKEILKPGQIVSETFPFERIQEALELAGSGKVGKVVLNMAQ